MKKTDTLFALAIVASTTLFAQTLEKDKDFIFTAGPSATKIINTNVSKDDYKEVDNKSGLNVNFSYNKYFNNRIGIGIGLGFSSYSQVVYQKGLFEKTNQKDRDGYDCSILIHSDMTYTTNLKYVDVPIVLHLLLGSSKTIYGFIDIGIVNGFLISGKNTEKGSVENMGKYPTNDPSVTYVIQNWEYYGYKERITDKEYTDVHKFYNASLRASVGVSAAMTDRLFLRVAPELTKGLSDVTGNDDKGKEYENAFGDKSAYKPTKTFSLGLNVGIAYNL